MTFAEFLTRLLDEASKREQELARLGVEGPAPRVSPRLVVGAAMLFAAGFILAIYDWDHDQVSDPTLVKFERFCAPTGAAQIRRSQWR